MNTLLSEQNLTTLFGLDELSEEERGDLVEDIGMCIVESATLRLFAEVSEEESVRFESVLAETGNGEADFDSILTEFPRFAELLTEETEAFKQEALAVLS